MRHAEQCKEQVEGGVVVGALLLLVGVALLLDSLGVVPIHQVVQYWPLPMIGFGIWLLLESEGIERRIAGGAIVFSGVVIEIQQLGYLRVRLEDLWPLAVIFVGVQLLWRAIAVNAAEPR